MAASIIPTLNQSNFSHKSNPNTEKLKGVDFMDYYFKLMIFDFA